MIDCRICILRQPHVHVRENVLELAHQPPDDFTVKPYRVTGVDFSLPSIKQDGKWWVVTHDLVNMVWPIFQRRARARARAKVLDSAFGVQEKEDQDSQENDE